MMLKEAEFAIVGSGFVGLALAIDLLMQGHSVAVLGNHFPKLPHPGNRVVAINLAAKSYLEYLQVWQKIPAPEPTPYTKMSVWEKDTNALVEFKNTDLNLNELGYIVVNGDLEKALWDRLDELTASLDETQFSYLEGTVTGLQTLQGRHLVTNEHNDQVFSTFLVGADGGRSFVRQALNIGVDRTEYSQTAVTCVIELPEPHNNTCYQSFHQNGILAYLPLAHPNQISVVWSINNDIVDHVLNYPEDVFVQEMYACFGAKLGVPKLLSKPSSFPLAKQYAQKIHGKNFVLIGDAAHTIHPLAGQGVNLGLADTWQFADLVREYYRPGEGLEQSNFDAYARRRKGRAVVVSEAMAVIKNTFGSYNPLVQGFRSLAMNLVNQGRLIKNTMINHALGYGEIQYSKASFDSKLDLDALKAEQTEQVNQKVQQTLEKLPLEQIQAGAKALFDTFIKK